MDVEMSVSQLADLLTEIGLEVEGVETHEQVKGGMEGIVIGEVKTCDKHPNADRLSLTTVDVGREDHLQVVCGAPNVAAGQKVLVATVGTTLYDKEGNPWKIKKGKIRGEVSEGMICAADEVGLGDDHSGIMVLEPDTETGKLAKDHFELKEDTVFEIGLTPNRSDATSHIGVAKDLAAALKVNHGFKGEVKLPEIIDLPMSVNPEEVKVLVENSQACPRFSGILIRDLEIKPSPGWLVDCLSAIGVRPINNIVDVTNFVLHEMGQPLHAYDWSKVGGHEVRVKTLPEGSKFTTLDEQERSLTSNDLMICDGNDAGMCIAGVFGGQGSGVTADSTSIFLESAHFDSKWVRRSSTRHLLFTDAAKVFEKGSDPNICVYALRRAAALICELAGGRIASEVIDIYPEPVKPKEVRLSYQKLARLVGAEISPDEVKNILLALEMEILEGNEDVISVAVPTNKSDVTREADLIEEVLRIYGYNKVPVQAKMTFAVHSLPQPDAGSIRSRISDYLSSIGFHEMMSMSMVDNKYVGAGIANKEEELIRINNTSHIHLEIMRPNLMVSALEAVRHNQNHQQTRIRLFEFGKSYQVLDGHYTEADHLTISLYGWSDESWLLSGVSEEKEYYVLKQVSEHVLSLLGLDHWKIEMADSPEFAAGVKYTIGRDCLAKLGVMHPDLCKKMDVKGPVFLVDFDWNKLLELARVDQVKVKPLGRFPSVRRDLALVLDKGVPYDDVLQSIKHAAGKTLEEVNLFDVYQAEKALGKGQKSYALSVTLRNTEKTFSDKEIEKIMHKILRRLEKDVHATLR